MYPLEKIILFEIDKPINLNRLLNVEPGIWSWKLVNTVETVTDDHEVIGYYQYQNEILYNIKSLFVDNEAYSKVVSMIDLRASNKSFYYDTSEYKFYIHFDQFEPPLSKEMYYGAGEGYSKLPNNLIKPYYGGNYFTPLLSEAPGIKKSIDPLFFGLLKYVKSSVTLINSSGEFDDWRSNDFFGQNARILVGDIDDDYTDFESAVEGFVSDDSRTFDKFKVKIEDPRRSLTQPIAANKLTLADYPYLKDENVDTVKPVCYGPILNAECICLNEDDTSSDDGVDATSGHAAISSTSLTFIGSTDPSLDTGTYDLDITIDGGALNQLTVTIINTYNWYAIAAVLTLALRTATGEAYALTISDGKIYLSSLTTGAASTVVIADGTAGVATIGPLLAQIDSQVDYMTTTIDTPIDGIAVSSGFGTISSSTPVDFIGAIVPGLASTTYVLGITVDGGALNQAEAIVANTDDWDAIAAAFQVGLRAETGGSETVVISGGNIVFTSGTTGASSKIVIEDGDDSGLPVAFLKWLPIVVPSMNPEIIRTSDKTFLICDTKYNNVFSLDNIYVDGVGTAITGNLNLSAGTFTMTKESVFDNVDNVSIDFTATNDYSGIDIILDLMKNYNNMPFNSSFWDLAEVNAATSRNSSLYIDKGTVKLAKGIESVCIDVDARFFVKNNGLYTIRIYDEDRTPNTKEIETTEWVGNPSTIDNNGSEFLSSVIIEYSKDQKNNDYSTYENTVYKEEVNDRYKKLKVGNYKTNLTTLADAKLKSETIMNISKNVQDIVERTASWDNFGIEPSDFVICSPSTRQSEDSVRGIYEVLKVNNNLKNFTIGLALRYIKLADEPNVYDTIDDNNDISIDDNNDINLIGRIS